MRGLLNAYGHEIDIVFLFFRIRDVRKGYMLNVLLEEGTEYLRDT
jgi:hypothetical protein